MASTLSKIVIVTTVLTTFFVLFGYVLVVISTPPAPLPSNVDNNTFSEGRAMTYTKYIADVHPSRETGTPGSMAVARYILSHGLHLSEVAEEMGHVTLEAYIEQTSQAFECRFLHTTFTNVYFNNTNVVFKLTPKGVDPRTKAVLINAHFDNSPGSPGASDCASCVGVLMELASVFVHDETLRLRAPVVMLFNGGEETLFQGAHAFMTAGRIPREDLGVFINLESTGPGGYDTMIQHKGGWTAEAFGRAAKTPKASVWAQDQLALGIIPGSTDFTIFAKYLPGIDLVFVMDAGAYHTHADKSDRIKPGTLQAMGENTVAVTREFCRVMAEDHSGEKAAANDTSVFFDWYTHFMVAYPLTLAKLLHNLPLVVALGLPMLTTATPTPSKGSTSVLQQYGAVLKALVVMIGAWVMACVSAGGVGLLRAHFSGRPMSWYGNHTATCLLYFPASIFGSMIPYVLLTSMQYSAVHTAYAILAGLLASGMTRLGLGGGFAFALTAGASCLIVTLDAKGSFGSLKSFFIAWVANLPALSLSMSVAIPGIMHVLEKITYIGSAPPPWRGISHDLGVGVLLGLAVFFHIALLLPFVMHNTRRLWKFMLPAVLLVSIVTALHVSVSPHYYSARLPKRVWINAITQVSADGDGSRGKLVLAAWDPISPQVVLPQAMQNDSSLPFDGKEWLAAFFVETVFLSHSMPLPADWRPPAHRLSDVVTLDGVEEGAGGVERMFFTLAFDGCEHLSLNISGPAIVSWSLTPEAPKLQGSSYLLWFSGTQRQQPWKFWMDVVGRSAALAVHIEYSKTYMPFEDSPQYRLVQDMPDWSSALLLDSTFGTATF